MKKDEELTKKITEMIKETQLGKINWKVQGQTTEYNDVKSKPAVEEDGKKWLVDECYISYECEYKGETFVLITYEMIHSCGQEVNTNNLVFLPPLGVRFFDLSTLLPYTIEADAMVLYAIHNLWLLILELAKEKSSQVEVDMSPRELTIEE